MDHDTLASCTGFDWDIGNLTKNWEKHNVSQAECEQIFFHTPLLLLDDEKHSTGEARYHALGRTNHHRFLFLVFTIRQNQIRVISARAMNKKERHIYEKASIDSNI